MRSQLLALLLMAAMLPLTSSTVAGPANASPSDTEGVRVIEVTAKKYEFNPSSASSKVREYSSRSRRLTMRMASGSSHSLMGWTPRETRALFFRLLRTVGRSRKGRWQQLSSWRKHREHTLSSAALAAVGITEQ